MSLGIIRKYIQSAAQTFTNNAVLADTQISFPVLAGQKAFGRFSGIVTVGATGGFQMQLTPSVAVSVYRTSLQIFNTATNNVARVALLASAALGSALANAGSHYIAGEFYFETAANTVITLQAAQNTADALTATLEIGLFADVTIL